MTVLLQGEVVVTIDCEVQYEYEYSWYGRTD